MVRTVAKSHNSNANTTMPSVPPLPPLPPLYFTSFRLRQTSSAQLCPNSVLHFPAVESKNSWSSTPCAFSYSLACKIISICTQEYQLEVVPGRIIKMKKYNTIQYVPCRNLLPTLLQEFVPVHIHATVLPSHQLPCNSLRQISIGRGLEIRG